MEDDQKGNETVRSIMSLEGLPFSVPAYQRGFRWQGARRCRFSFKTSQIIQ